MQKNESFSDRLYAAINRKNKEGCGLKQKRKVIGAITDGWEQPTPVYDRFMELHNAETGKAKC